MATYQKSHPSNSWELEYEKIQAMIADTEAHKNSLAAQLDECDVKIASAQSVIDLLADSTSRRDQQEVAERRRFINQHTRLKENVQKAFDVVASRLDTWTAKQKDFPKTELAKERKLRQARASSGRVSVASGAEKFLTQ